LSVCVAERIAANAHGDLTRARAIVEGFRPPPSVTAAAHEHRLGVANMNEEQKLAFVRGVLEPNPPADGVLREVLSRERWNTNAALDYLLGPQGPCTSALPPPAPAATTRRKSNSAPPADASATAVRREELARQRNDIEQRERMVAQRAKEREAALEARVAELQRALAEAEARLKAAEAPQAERERLQSLVHSVEADKIDLARQLAATKARTSDAGGAAASSKPKEQSPCEVTARAVVAADGTFGLAYTWDLHGVQPTPKSWLGLYYSDREFANKHSAWVSLNGKATGKGVFPNLRLGYWDVRLYLGDSNVEQARSPPTLLGPRVAVDAKFIPDDRRFEVTWAEELPEGAQSTLAGRDWIGLYRVGTHSNKKCALVPFPSFLLSLSFFSTLY